MKKLLLILSLIFISKIRGMDNCGTCLLKKCNIKDKNAQSVDAEACINRGQCKAECAGITIRTY